MEIAELLALEEQGGRCEGCGAELTGEGMSGVCSPCRLAYDFGFYPSPSVSLDQSPEPLPA